MMNDPLSLAAWRVARWVGVDWPWNPDYQNVELWWDNGVTIDATAMTRAFGRPPVHDLFGGPWGRRDVHR